MDWTGRVHVLRPEGMKPMTTDTQGGMSLTQTLIWLGVIIVILGAVYYFI